MQRGMVNEVLLQGQIAIEAAALKDHAEVLQRRHWPSAHVVAENADFTAGIIVKPGGQSK